MKMPISTAWRSSGLVVLGAAAVACGLEIAGAGPSEVAGGAGEDASTGTRSDAATDAARPETDAQTSADSGCVPVVIDDPLTTIDPLRWRLSSTQADYPVAKDPGAGVTMVALNATMQPSQRAGLWLRERVPTTAFDVSFDYLVACTDDAYCADGVAAAWVDTTDAGALDNGNAGRALGIPKLSGGAAAIRLDVRLDDPDLAEDTFPTLMVHAMDAGPSTETATAVQRHDPLVGQVRRVTLRLRNGQITAKSVNDAGTAVDVTGPTRAGFLGYFGFTASTGQHYDAAYVASFHGEFYACTPP